MSKFIVRIVTDTAESREETEFIHITKEQVAGKRASNNCADAMQVSERAEQSGPGKMEGNGTKELGGA